MELEVLKEHTLGVSWVVDEAMQRGSHALAADGRVWLVDPVDVPEAIAKAEALGEVAGVVQLLDRHPRDCAALAKRFGVPHLRLPAALPGTPFEVLPVLDMPGWREVALWWPEARALVVAETVGSGRYFALGAGPLGIHPMLRALTPGAALRDKPAEWVLVGHGPPVDGPGTEAALKTAFTDARRDLPKLAARLSKILRSLV